MQQTGNYQVGIDLGTTFTAAATAKEGRCEIATLGTRNPTIPSVVVLSDDGTVLTGEAAQRRALTDPTRVAREFKRRVGDPLPVIVGGSPHSAESLSALLLRSVVERVTGEEGGAPSLVALTHPANWGNYKKELYEQAVRMADVRNVVLLTEPEAAAIHYASQQRVDTGSLVAVYDLGGGTFDATILRTGEHGFETVGQPEGIERLGGIDFDQAVYTHVADALGGALDDVDRNDPAVLSAVARLRQECVEAKEALSSDTEASVSVALPGLHTEVRITRPELEAMLRRPIADTVAAMRRALRDAGVEPDQLTAVLLVGGSSRIPMIAEMVGAELGRPVAIDAHPKYSIALGAARYASMVHSGAIRARVIGSSAPSRVAAEPSTPADTPARAQARPVPEPAATGAAPEPPRAAPVQSAPSNAAPSAVAASSAETPPSLAAPDATVTSLQPAISAKKGPNLKVILAGVGVAAVLGIGAAVALGGGDEGGGGGNAGGDGCPASGPFVCITSASLSDGQVSAQFRVIDGEVSNNSPALFFLESAPNSGVPWDRSDPFSAQIGSGAAGSRLCVVLQSAGGGSGNCVTLKG